MKNEVVDSSRFFFSHAEYSKWEISNNVISAMKELVASQFDGAYVEKGLCWEESRNEEILDKYRGQYDRNVFLSHIGIAMQLLTRTVKMHHIPKEVIDKLGIKDYHIKLLNQLYIDHDNYDNSIGTGDKRPFGNSNYVGDVLDVYNPGRYEDDDIDDDYENDNRDIAERIYNEVIELARIVISLYPIDFRNFNYCDYTTEDTLMDAQREYVNHNWVPSVMEFRNIKIDQILQ